MEVMLVKNRLMAIMCIIMIVLFAGTAMAETSYLIPDSNTRQLTKEELWTWDYESLGYILNEIFARHGYNFIPEGQYDIFFRNRPWYSPNEDSNNQRACYSQLNQVEWYNEQLIKEVRTEMRNTKNYNSTGKSVWDIDFADTKEFGEFKFITLEENQLLPVYSAPTMNSWRGADGKAAVSTNDTIYAAGWESGWLLVMYEINNGAMRIGYIDGNDLHGNVPNSRILDFAYQETTVNRRCTLTDDPIRTNAFIATLMPGTAVIYLTTYTNELSWAYVETTQGGQIMRGFIPSDCIELASDGSINK